MERPCSHRVNDHMGATRLGARHLAILPSGNVAGADSEPVLEIPGEPADNVPGVAASAAAVFVGGAVKAASAVATSAAAM